jgi:CRP/FNR family transcriptional regulator, cyclic AMP receptor protein
MHELSPAGVGHSEIALAFAQAATQKKFPAKATIVKQGDDSRDLFLILRGSVTFRLETPSGHDLVLGIAHAGEFFGEIGLFETAASTPWRVRARSTCDVAQIAHAQLEGNLPLLATLWPTLTAQLAARLDRQEKKAGEMAFCDATARVHSALLDLVSAPDAQRRPDGFAISITRVELAAMSAVSREAVGRILMRLQERGVLRVKNRTVVMLTSTNNAVRYSSLPPVRPVSGLSVRL